MLFPLLQLQECCSSHLLDTTICGVKGALTKSFVMPCSLRPLSSEARVSCRGKETSSVDVRRTSARTLKRKAAWGPTVGGALPEQAAEQSVQQEQLQERRHQQQQGQQQQQQQVSTPLSQNGQPCGQAHPQILSPPDMVWPANTLAQVLS